MRATRTPQPRALERVRTLRDAGSVNARPQRIARVAGGFPISPNSAANFSPPGTVFPDDDSCDLYRVFPARYFIEADDH
jgi:hypothetical protein